LLGEGRESKRKGILANGIETEKKKKFMSRGGDTPRGGLRRITAAGRKKEKEKDTLKKERVRRRQAANSEKIR